MFKGNDEINFAIKAHFGSIGIGSKGWKKELNLVSWNGNEAKFDLRDWDETHTKMGKGVTFTKNELQNLKHLLSGEQEQIVLEAPKEAPSEVKTYNIADLKTDISL